MLLKRLLVLLLLLLGGEAVFSSLLSWSRLLRRVDVCVDVCVDVDVDGKEGTVWSVSCLLGLEWWRPPNREPRA